MANVITVTVRTKDESGLSAVESKFKASGEASGKGFSDEFGKSTGKGMLGSLFGKGGGSVTSDAQRTGQNVGLGLGRGIMQKFSQTLGSGLLSGLMGTSGGSKLFGSAGNTVVQDAAKQGQSIAQGLGKGLNDGLGSAQNKISGLLSGLFGGSQSQGASDPLGVDELSKKIGALITRAASLKIGADDKGAQATLLRLQLKLDELSKKVSTPKIDLKGSKGTLADILTVDSALDKLSKKTATASLGSRLAGLIPGIGGGGGGEGAAGGAAGGSGSEASGGLSGISEALTNPYVLAGGISAALGALPFVAQAAAGGIVAALGGGLAAIAIIGAAKNKTVQKSFDDLKTNASSDLTKIGEAFVPVLNSILGNASSLMKKMEPIFAGAAKTISGPFQQFGDALLKAFGSPAVQNSINAVAKAFGSILTALSPSLSRDIGVMAEGITNIANAVAKNPDAFRNFISFLFQIVGYTLNAIAWLSNMATYIEVHFRPAISDIAKFSSDMLRDTRTIWNDLYGATVGVAIRIGHNVETQFNSLQHATANIFDGIRSVIATIWNQIWNNTVGRVARGVSDVVSWVRKLPGQIIGAVGDAGSVLANWGAGVIKGLLSGMSSIIGSVWNFIKGIPGKILNFLGIHSPPQWAIDAGKHIMNGLGIGMSQAQAKANAATANFKQSIASQVAGNFGGGVLSASASQAQAMARQMAASLGWNFTDLNNVAMRESGWSMTATNPSSGAYGIAQFIDGPSEYAQYGGNANTLSGQLTAFFGYIRQRYGNPTNAWAHEQQFGWYAGGGATSPGWAMVGEHGRELVKMPGGATVVPHGTTEQMVAGGAAGGLHLVLELGDSFRNIGLTDAQLKDLRYTIRTKGGGNVQRALGTS